MTFLPRKLMQLVECVDIDVQHIFVAEEELHRLLLLVAHRYAVETGEAADPIVDVYHKISGAEVLDFSKRESTVGLFPFTLRWAVVALKYLVDRKSTRLNSSHVAISYAV